MARTVKADLWAPEVWQQLATEAFKNKLIVAASSATVENTTLVGQPGDTIVFPSWMNMSEIEDIDENDVLEVEKLTQKARRATIKEAGKAFGISDQAKLIGLGDAQQEAVRQFGILTQRKIDRDVIAAATATTVGGVTYADGTTATDTAPMTTTLTGGYTWENLVSLGLMFEDGWDPAMFTGLFINSADSEIFLLDEKFLQANQTSAGNVTINRGVIGTKNGLSIFITNQLAPGKGLLLRPGALGIIRKRYPLVEFDRDILARTDVVALNMHYGTSRLADDRVVDITLA